MHKTRSLLCDARSRVCKWQSLFDRLVDDADAGHAQYVQDIYENEYRMPGSDWKKPTNDFTDIVSQSFQTL